MKFIITSLLYTAWETFFSKVTTSLIKTTWYYGYITILDISKSGISFEIVPYKFNTTATKITFFDEKDKETMMKYIEKLSDIIKDEEKLKNYFKGWSFNHLWIPQLPENIENLKNYNSSGNYDLLKCEAHLSQAKQIFEILFNDEIQKAKEMSEKIKILQKMPI